MLCDSPITLKSGLVVPCGKCLMCLSHRRDEWSIRMQLHADYSSCLPFFCTFTYDDDHLPFDVETGACTLSKRDFQLFVKRLKDRLDLYNGDFAFVACGEYGDTLGRPHVHAILFGLDKLSQWYERGFEYCNSKVSEIWQNGFVYCGPASYGGVHYTSKYVLKLLDRAAYDGVQAPFLLASHGIGAPWLQSDEAKYIKNRLDFFRLHGVAFPPLDVSSFASLRDSARDAIITLRGQFPKFVAHLSDGKTVPLPSYLRKKLVGSFEHFTDNPLWRFETYNKIYQSCEYILNYGDSDRESSMSHQEQLIDFARRKIKQRLILSNRL